MKRPERAAGRLGVDGFCERAELHAALSQVIEDHDQVAQGAGQSVQLPHNQRVAALERFQAADQGRPLGGRAAHAVVGEYFFASGLLQGRVLQF